NINMEGNLLENMTADELIQAQAHVWSYSFNYVVTMCLKCVVELRVPDAIYRHGAPMSLSDLISELPLHPMKTDALRRVLRLLIQAGFFTAVKQESGEEHYSLTPAGRLLVEGVPGAAAPHIFVHTNPKTMSSWGMLSTWFQISDNPVPYEAGSDGVSYWENLEKDPEQKKVFFDAMAGDSELIATVLASEDYRKEVFEGVETMVDVGGGTGVFSVAIAKAFPDMKCILFDLPDVVKNFKDVEVKNLEVVGGDMFQDPIPTADAVFLKWVLHGLDDERCAKILKSCREAVSSSTERKKGKVIIVDMVVDTDELSQVQLCYDILMMGCHNGKERTEDEWRIVFDSAGFSGYKIVRSLGPRSIIEAYP
ncbi:Probable O-methyltransferase 3, partial [Linum grandiflorum]